MSEVPIYRCFARAVEGPGGPPVGARHWVGARRQWLRIYADRIECGDWTVAFHEVRAATNYRTRPALLPRTVLELVTAERVLQFGFGPWARPLEYLPFSMDEQQLEPELGPVGLLAWVVVVGVVAWLILG